MIALAALDGDWSDWIAIIEADDLHLLRAFRRDTPENDTFMRRYLRDAFHVAAARGQIVKLRWLHETFQLTTECKRFDAGVAFRCACENGHLDVTQWLHETFQLILEDVRADDNFALGRVLGWTPRCRQVAARDVPTRHRRLRQL